MPPPNVTGSLHGPCFNIYFARYYHKIQRMDGFKTLWQPGTDHAGIATQNVVEKQLLAEGLRKKIGRERFLEELGNKKRHLVEISFIK